jgi:hypothetical protein
VELLLAIGADGRGTAQLPEQFRNGLPILGEGIADLDLGGCHGR